LNPEINVELTSSSSQEKIMEMQCELLVSNFNDPKTIRLVKENIARISDGSSPHCGGSLKLGLKKAFELRRQTVELKKQALALELKKQQEQALELEKQKKAGVLLRCHNTSCTWHSNPVSYTSVPANGVCGVCRNHWMLCVGCGNARTGNYTSCQSCGRTFA
jgi:hypothetical protein